MTHNRTGQTKADLIWQLIRKQIVKRSFVRRELDGTPVIVRKPAVPGPAASGRHDA